MIFPFSPIFALIPRRCEDGSLVWMEYVERVKDDDGAIYYRPIKKDDGPTTITLHSGDTFDFRNPENCLYHITDIAHALANTCRFAGHTKEFYSVAQHSVLVSQQVEKKYRLAALLHDASEAFGGDVVKPLKRILPDYQKIEKDIERAIQNRYQLRASEESKVAIKKADIALLSVEQFYLMTKCSIQTAPFEITPLPPKEAKELFLDAYRTYLDTYCFET